MAYDHRKKAGNQGDVIKHVALIAALDNILENHQRPIFEYADTFAGYAHNPLVKGDEWEHGIGKIFQHEELGNNVHTAVYKKWYLSRPALLGGMYPGSSLIASDVCAWKKKKAHLSLWDTEQSVVEDLNKVFHGQGHSIFYREAAPSELISVDFLLVDPPKNIGDDVRVFFETHNKPVIAWLPVGPNTTSSPPSEDKKSDQVREWALNNKYGVTKVRWSKGGRTIGCQLVYRLPNEARSALREAVGHVTMIAEWECDHYPD